MSISKAREIIEKPGCGVTVGVLMIFAMIAGIFQCNQGGPGQDTDAAKQTSPPIAKLGTSVISYEGINAAYQKTETSITQNGSTIDGPFIPQILASVVGEGIRQIATIEVGKKYGITIKDEEAVSNFQKTLDEEVIRMRGQMIGMGKLKADASAAEFNAAFKKEAGRDLDEVLKNAKEQFAKSLEDPASRVEAVSGLVEKAIQEKVMTTIKVEDADLKRYRDSLEVKQIAVQEKAEADAALKLAKESSFEAAMDKYSLNGAPEGKKKSEQTQPIQFVELLKTEPMAALKTLKVGQISGIIDMGGSFAIYKLVKVTPGVIKDFAKEKDQLLLEARQQISGRKVFDEIQEAKKGDIEWADEGYKALYTLFNASSKKERDEIVKQLIDAAPPSGGMEETNRVMTFARFSAASQYFSKLPKDQLLKEVDKKLAIYSEFLNYTESSQLRIEMAKDLMAKKDAAAADQILTAANSNTAYETGNQTVWSDVQANLAKLKEMKLGTPEQWKEIETRQATWKSEKLAFDKAKAEEAARMAEEQKKFEAEQKKAVEEAKKAEAAKKAGTDKKKDDKPAAPSSGDLLKPGGN